MTKRGLSLSAVALLALVLAPAERTVRAAPGGGPTVLINEVDADTAGTDILEFIELYDGGSGNTDLTGLVVVLFNGSSDTSYQAVDLDGFSTDANGYFLIGNVDVVPPVDIVVPSNFVQNGADAVTIFNGDDTDFPTGTPVTTVNIVDAFVYDTNDADDVGLLALMNPGEPQINEDNNGNKDFDSNQRCPDGSGGAQNSSTYVTALATPRAPCDTSFSFSNYCVAFPNSVDVNGGLMGILGSGSIAANDSSLTCSGVPAQPGVFVMGSNQDFVLPFGNGVLCVEQPFFRLTPPVLPVANTSTRALDFVGPGPENMIMGGQTWNFQYIYRDPGQGAGFNASDGLEVTFAL